jgi:hypothetical protein
MKNDKPEIKPNKFKDDPASKLMRVTGMGRVTAEAFVAGCTPEEKALLESGKVDDAICSVQHRKEKESQAKPSAGMSKGKPSVAVSEAASGQASSGSQ